MSNYMGYTYQAGKIEKLKLHLEKVRMSFKDYFQRYFKKYGSLDYLDFLKLLNWDESWTAQMQKAYDDFCKDYP